jgi:putative ABC transport system permease protein
MALPLSYNVRSLRVRWQVTLLAIAGIAMVVAVFVVLAALAAGFRIALRSTGRTDNAMIVQKGSMSEMTSGIPRAHADIISVDSRVARDDKGQPLASPEIMLVVNLRRVNDNAETNVALRGVTLKALEVRGPITVTKGRVFTPGLYELMVGERTSERFGLQIGKTLRLQRREWTVVGIFQSDGSGFESEIWADVNVLGPAFNRTGGFQSLVVRLKDPSTLEALRASIVDNPQFQLKVDREIDYYDAQAGGVAAILMGLAWFVSIVMAIGAVVGAMNTMYAIVAARTREIGTLRALGFSRLSILTSFVLESLVLAFVAGVIGCLIAMPANWLTGSTGQATFSELSFAFKVTTDIVISGMIFALLMGLIGGLLPAFRAARMPITVALRSA